MSLRTPKHVSISAAVVLGGHQVFATDLIIGESCGCRPTLLSQVENCFVGYEHGLPAAGGSRQPRVLTGHDG